MSPGEHAFTGGVLVLCLGDCLTMFTASLLYILSRSFEQICIVKPYTACAASSCRFLVGLGYLPADGLDASAATYLLQVISRLLQRFDVYSRHAYMVSLMGSLGPDFPGTMHLALRAQF